MEVDLGSGRTAKSVSIGKGFACVILDDDTLKCWGANTYGQLGVGDATTRDAPAGPVNLGSGRTAKAVVCGGVQHLRNSGRRQHQMLGSFAKIGVLELLRGLQQFWYHYDSKE